MSAILTALFFAAPAPAPAGAASPLPVHVGGRVAAEPGGAMRFGWPGVYFEGRFRGTGVEVTAESGTEFLRVTIDGEEKAVLKRPGTARLQIRGLAPGEHIVRIEKQTESQTGGGRFLGFRALGGVPLPPKPRKLQIEFVGDSYTVGYGNTSPGRTCTREEVQDRTDTQRAFGPLLAKRLDADYRVVAYSGFGIVRNYAGGRAGESLPLLYPRLIPDEAAQVERNRGDWRPQLIVVNLGTNDFSTPVKPGEPWRDTAALREDYRRTYTAFARSLLARQPQARLLLMGSDAFIEDVRQVASALNPDRARATVLPFGGLELTGCDWHPSLEDHRRLAAEVEQAIRAEPSLKPVFEP
jgi:lysophospholipase L1-like esterase